MIERIDRMLDKGAFLLERALAYLFIAAVCLNFANVIGRYLFGRSILSADELQVYAMILMTFLGAVVVTWRRQHLRMDVLMETAPDGLRRGVRIFETLVFVAICGFVLYQSSFYANQMLLIGRASDMAGVPMWIPHGAIALSFGLMLLVLVWRSVGASRRPPVTASEAAKIAGEGAPR